MKKRDFDQLVAKTMDAIADSSLDRNLGIGDLEKEREQVAKAAEQHRLNNLVGYGYAVLQAHLVAYTKWIRIIGSDMDETATLSWGLENNILGRAIKWK
jgi:hypothetical protein